LLNERCQRLRHVCVPWIPTRRAELSPVSQRASPGRLARKSFTARCAKGKISPGFDRRKVQTLTPRMPKLRFASNNLPRADKLVDADIQELRGDRVAKRSLPRAEVIVFSGSSGNVVAPTRNHVKVTMVEVRLAPNATLEQELPAQYNGFAVVLEGGGFHGCKHHTRSQRPGRLACARE